MMGGQCFPNKETRTAFLELSKLTFYASPWR
jgi:hypothetical protein